MKHFILKCLLMVLILTWGQLLNAQNVTGSFKGKALSEVVKELEHQTGYSFIYEISDLKSAASVTASFENAPLEKVLPEIIKSPLKYDIKGKIVVITKGEIAQQPAPKS
jgi:hypothetical protein